MKFAKSTVSVALGASALALILLALRTSDDSEVVEPAALETDSTGCSSGSSTSGGTEAGAAGNDPRPTSTGVRVGEEPQSTRRGSGIEEMLTRGGTLDMSGVMRLASGTGFDSLAAELRSEGGETGALRRAEFEAIAYAHPNILDGSVTLDMVECGASLCVAELRGADQAVLQNVTRDILVSDDFFVPAITELPGSEIYSDGESKRLLFAHDPAILGITIPEDALEASEQPLSQ